MPIAGREFVGEIFIADDVGGLLRHELQRYRSDFPFDRREIIFVERAKLPAISGATVLYLPEEGWMYPKFAVRFPPAYIGHLHSKLDNYFIVKDVAWNEHGNEQAFAHSRRLVPIDRIGGIFTTRLGAAITADDETEAKSCPKRAWNLPKQG